VGINPTHTCTAASMSHAFDYYTGEESNYIQQQNEDFYFK
jgi:hypothetical protein